MAKRKARVNIRGAYSFKIVDTTVDGFVLECETDAKVIRIHARFYQAGHLATEIRGYIDYIRVTLADRVDWLTRRLTGNV